MNYHGVSQTKVGKFCWFLVVCLGFTGAGYLIQSSYSDWQKSPVSTSITTRAISDLDFPTVTVCPPKGSHTALNYDLMKADTDSLTEQDRDNLKEAVYNTITEHSHQDYIRSMLATVNQANVRKTVEGFHNFPETDQNGRVIVIMANNYGKIHTPQFREIYEKDYYQEDRKLAFQINISEELKAQVGSGSLVVELEVDTREEEGWQEVVEYSASAHTYRSDRMLEYKLYRESKTWSDAEAHCQREGGHLASVVTQDEEDMVVAATGGDTVWLGGTNQEGIWRWTDESVFTYEQWGFGYGSNRESSKCVVVSGYQARAKRGGPKGPRASR